VATPTDILSGSTVLRVMCTRVEERLASTEASTGNCDNSFRLFCLEPLDNAQSHNFLQDAFLLFLYVSTPNIEKHIYTDRSGYTKRSVFLSMRLFEWNVQYGTPFCFWHLALNQLREKRKVLNETMTNLSGYKALSSNIPH
jgi:hypothetical protein